MTAWPKFLLSLCFDVLLFELLSSLQILPNLFYKYNPETKLPTAVSRSNLSFAMTAGRILLVYFRFILSLGSFYPSGIFRPFSTYARIDFPLLKPLMTEITFTTSFWLYSSPLAYVSWHQFFGTVSIPRLDSPLSISFSDETSR